MSTLLAIGLANAACAAVLAVAAWLAGRLRCRPALVHALWLLVLLKLVTPPLVRSGLPWLPAAPAPAPAAPRIAVVPAPAPKPEPGPAVMPVPVSMAVGTWRAEPKVTPLPTTVDGTQ